MRLDSSVPPSNLNFKPSKSNYKCWSKIRREMKPSEFSEVLIPPTEKDSSTETTTATSASSNTVSAPPPYVFTNIIGGSSKKPSDNNNKDDAATARTTVWMKFFVVLTILVLVGITTALIFTVLRYETKMIQHEARTAALETHLDEFIEAFEIKALIAALRSNDHIHHHHDEDDGHDLHYNNNNGHEFDFSVLDEDQQHRTGRLPPAPLAAATASSHHFRSISDMSDEDYVPFQPISIVEPIVNKNKNNGLLFASSEEEESNEDNSSASYEEPETDKQGDVDDEANERIEEEIVFGELKLQTPETKHKHHSHSRSKRQVSSRNGVPIVQGSYQPTGGGSSNLLPVPTPTESEGLRLYESLVTTGGHGEPKAREFHESDGTNVQPYHRASAAWSERGSGSSGRRLELRSGDYGSSSFGSGPTIASDYFYTRGQSKPSTSTPTFYTGSNAVYRQSWRSTVSDNTSTRSSRAQNTGTGDNAAGRQNRFNPPLRKFGEGDGEVVARVHQDGSSTTHTREPIGQATSGANYDGTVTSYAESRHYRANAAGSTQRGAAGQRTQAAQRQRKVGTNATRTRNLNRVQSQNPSANVTPRPNPYLKSLPPTTSSPVYNPYTPATATGAQRYAPRFDTQDSFDEKHQDYLKRHDVYAQSEGIVSRRNLDDRFSLYKKF